MVREKKDQLNATAIIYGDDRKYGKIEMDISIRIF